MRIRSSDGGLIGYEGKRGRHSVVGCVSETPLSLKALI